MSPLLFTRIAYMIYGFKAYKRLRMRVDRTATEYRKASIKKFLLA